MTPTQIISALDKDQQAQGMTDTALLKIVQIHRSTLWRIKNGVTPATLEQVSAIAEALGHTINIKWNLK